jgi:uncharacterized membrane protein
MRLLAASIAGLVALAAGSAQGADTQGIVGSVTVNPLSVEVTFPTDPIKSGRWFRINASITNAAPSALDNVAITLVHPAGLQLGSQDTQTIPRIPALGSKPAKWDACSNTPGSYVVLARAEVKAYVSESSAKVVQVIQSKLSC